MIPIQQQQTQQTEEASSENVSFKHCLTNNEHNCFLRDQLSAIKVFTY